MKRKKLLKTSSIVLVLALFMSTILSAFADTTNTKAGDSTDKWVTKASMTYARNALQTETVNGKIYAIGGNEGYGKGVTEEYDPTTDKWTTKASMSVQRYLFQTEEINGILYAIGGLDSSPQSILSTVEAYDPAADKWTPKASMNNARSSFHTEVVNGKIYAIGGIGSSDGKINLLSVEEYDPITDKWTPKASMNYARSEFQTEVIDGKIYAIGGRDSDTHSMILPAEIYDPQIDKWTDIASLTTGRQLLSTQIVNGKIYAIGGITKNDLTSAVEEYTAAEPTQSPTLTVTPSSDKVKINDQFTTTVAIHKGTNICAEDIKLTYDTNLFEYLGADAQKGLKIMKEDSTTTPGTIRFIVSCLGKDNAATGDKDLITLKFKAKKPGQGKVDITKGRIADNATLEMDVADADCGEATITVESNKDVNRSGDVTLLDLGIDSWYYGSDAKDTDSTKYDADVMPNGKIDDDDLSEITQGILSNSKYPNN
ncbi:MAG TPA: cohesin domain-containing protein [Oscillospiraceae bacterium]|nr:cohesin domain-containing protein [Oscillospiraceae bacterium]